MRRVGTHDDDQWWARKDQRVFGRKFNAVWHPGLPGMPVETDVRNVAMAAQIVDTMGLRCAAIAVADSVALDGATADDMAARVR